MKKILICLFSFIAVFTIALTPAKAASNYNLAYDESDLLDSEYIQYVGETLFDQITKQTKIEFRVDVITDLQGLTLDQAAETLAQNYNYGYPETGDLIYLLLAVEVNDNDLKFVDFDIYSRGQNYDSFKDLADKIFDKLVVDLNENTFSGDVANDNLAFKLAIGDMASLALNDVVPAEKVITELSNVFSDTTVLSVSQLEALNQKAAAVSKKHNSGVYIDIVADMREYGYTDIEKFAEHEYERLNLGMRNDHDGTLLVLSMGDRDYSLIAHGEFANYSYTDYGKDLLVEYFLDDFRFNEYNQGFEDFIEQCDIYLTAAEDGNPIDVPPKAPLIQRIITAVTGSIVPALVFALFKSLGLKSGLKTTKIQTTAFDYVKNTRGYIYHRRDNLLNHYVSRHKIEKTSGSSGPSGHGGTTVSSSGYSSKSGKF